MYRPIRELVHGLAATPCGPGSQSPIVAVRLCGHTPSIGEKPCWAGSARPLLLNGRTQYEMLPNCNLCLTQKLPLWQKIADRARDWFGRTQHDCHSIEAIACAFSTTHGLRTLNALGEFLEVSCVAALPGRLQLCCQEPILFSQPA